MQITEFRKSLNIVNSVCEEVTAFHSEIVFAIFMILVIIDNLFKTKKKSDTKFFKAERDNEENFTSWKHVKPRNC